MAREGLAHKGLRRRECNVWTNSSLGRGSSTCKGPGMQVYLADLGMTRPVCGWRLRNEAHLAVGWLVSREGFSN